MIDLNKIVIEDCFDEGNGLPCKNFDLIVALHCDLLDKVKEIKELKDKIEGLEKFIRTYACPVIKNWHDFNIVKISSVEDPKGFSNWLYGQTRPLVDDDEDPYDWAYEWDYQRYKRKLPVID